MKSVLCRLRSLWFCAAVLAMPLMAEENAKSSEGGQDLWKWLNFAILAGVLGWLIAKNLGPVLTARSREIEQGLAAGEKAKAEADARAAAVQARLAGLENTVAQMRTASREELARETERIQRETASELARIEQQSTQEIESAGKLARLEVQRYAAELAIDLAEQKVRARMSPDKQAELVRNFSGGLASGS